MIPDFNSFKKVPTGIHETSLHEIHKHFVMAFPSSKTRPSIFDGLSSYLCHLSALTYTRILHCFYLGGGFISNEIAPENVDIICFITGSRFDAFERQHPGIKAFIYGNATPHRNLCQTFFAVSYFPEDPLYDYGAELDLYWEELLKWNSGHEKTGLLKTLPFASMNTAPLNLATDQEIPCLAGYSFSSRNNGSEAFEKELPLIESLIEKGQKLYHQYPRPSLALSINSLTARLFGIV